MKLQIVIYFLKTEYRVGEWLWVVRDGFSNEMAFGQRGEWQESELPGRETAGTRKGSAADTYTCPTPETGPVVEA